MGRPAKGWRIREQKGSTVLAVAFTWPLGSGKEVVRTTGERELRAAEKKAARIYADWIRGAPQAPAQQYTAREPGDSTRELVKRWLTSGETTQRARTLDEYARYFEATLCDAFPTLTDTSPDSVTLYSEKRLRSVLPATVRKELSALRALGRWAEPREDWDRRVPGIPKETKGRKWHQRRRGKATPLTPSEMATFLAALPQWSRWRHCTTESGEPAKLRWPIRARFILAYETGLRPATLSNLSVPEHWTPGATHLIITDEIDKAKYGREVPLTPAALAALSGVVEAETFAAGAGVGLLFGSHDYRSAVATAAKSSGLPLGRAASLCPYDIRHARATHLGASPQADLNGMMAMFGWRRVETASKYVHPPKRAAAEMLARIGELGGGVPVGTTAPSAKSASAAVGTDTPERAEQSSTCAASPATTQQSIPSVQAASIAQGADDEPLTGFG